ncbi:MAG: hypothetical protein GJ676_17510 [Rhodobacteraceae bacterium]|nr:hypothetical protein [Paracoccaceae bacterium]
MLDLKSERFTTETGTRVLVQVPETEAQAVLQVILKHDPLAWGDYDQVAFFSPPGRQQFRSLPGGRNAPTDEAMSVSCVEIQVFSILRGTDLEAMIRAVYNVHPYEEPVIQLIPALRTRHIPGVDEDNPNRFWNREMPDWVPEPHRHTSAENQS